MIYDSIDCYWSWDGDYATGPDGDLADTSSDYLLSIRQEIMTVVKSELGDWLGDQIVGANLSDFVGEPNTEANGLKIRDRLITKLTEIGIVSQGDLTVQVIPTGIYQLLIMISLTVAMTQNNSLVAGQQVNVGVVYDTMENGIFFLPPVDNSAITAAGGK